MKRLALTVGDPAGIGPEIVLKALAAPGRPRPRFVVYGPAAVLEERARRFGLAWPLGGRPASGRDVRAGEVPLGAAPRRRAGGRPPQAVLRAAERRAGRARRRPRHRAPQQGVAGRGRPPLARPHRDARRRRGCPRRGHAVRRRRAARRAGDHPPLAALGARRHHARRGASAWRAWCTASCRALGAAHAAASPCAGSTRTRARAGSSAARRSTSSRRRSRRLRAEGIDVSGPFPADSLFVRASRGEFDAVIAQYHDQGLIPVKLVAFGHAVNVTLGLPFVRTSVDHGTGFDIVASGHRRCGKPARGDGARGRRWWRAASGSLTALSGPGRAPPAGCRARCPCA